MASKLFRLSKGINASHVRAFTSTSRSFAATVDSHFISLITVRVPISSIAFVEKERSEKALTIHSHAEHSMLTIFQAAEKEITKQDNPVANGPTAQAQSHANTPLTAKVIHDITMGERLITGLDRPVPSGPTSIAQSILSQGSTASGFMDGETISKITEAEKDLTGSNEPVRRGPTAKAQQHAGEKITSEVLSDITKGEKKITGGERVKGGPTAAAQSELSKSRQ